MARFLRVTVLLALVVGFSFPALFAQDARAKKVLMVIAPENFQDDEFARPRDILKDNGVRVFVASSTLSEVKGMNGMMVVPDLLLGNVIAGDYDAVLFIGGSGAAVYLEDEVAQGVARDTLAANKVLGAICIAPVILANAGILSGKTATVWPTEGSRLTAKGAIYSANPVEKDGSIITADGPDSAKQFGEEVLAALNI